MGANDRPIRLMEPNEGIDPIAKKICEVFFEKSSSGWRYLEPNEFRVSQTADCSWKLFFNKILPQEEPQMGPIRFNEYNGLVTPHNGGALAGTFAHEKTQELLKGFITDAERKVTWEDNAKFVKISGHIDLEHQLNGKLSLTDIKTMAGYGFKSVVGEEYLQPGGYWDKKRRKSILTTNVYANIVGTKYYNIMWMDRSDLRFKIEKFETDETKFHEIHNKLVNVLNTVNSYKTGNTDAKPIPCGITMCNYCDHRNKVCPGSDLLARQSLNFD